MLRRLHARPLFRPGSDPIIGSSNDSGRWAGRRCLAEVDGGRLEMLTTSEIGLVKVLRSADRCGRGESSLDVLPERYLMLLSPSPIPYR